ncbi:hypothetical protein DXG01_015654 [Tephrocybe rancida]|nr:hypothetical protein DXG01_015654 [Tephrocybe rancida]
MRGPAMYGSGGSHDHAQLFAVLIPTLEDPEHQVHSHSAATLIYFCEGVARDTLSSFDPIVERLLKLFNPSGDAGNVTSTLYLVHVPSIV